MAANHERVLWVVEQCLKDDTPVRWWVFRSRDNARLFQQDKNRRSKKYHYHVAGRAVWGPE